MEKIYFADHFLDILERKRTSQRKKLLIPQNLLDFEKVYIQSKVCFAIVGFEKDDNFYGILKKKRKIQRKKFLFHKIFWILRTNVFADILGHLKIISKICSYNIWYNPTDRCRLPEEAELEEGVEQFASWNNTEWEAGSCTR